MRWMFARILLPLVWALKYVLLCIDSVRLPIADLSNSMGQSLQSFSRRASGLRRNFALFVRSILRSIRIRSRLFSFLHETRTELLLLVHRIRGTVPAAVQPNSPDDNVSQHNATEPPSRVRHYLGRIILVLLWPVLVIVALAKIGLDVVLWIWSRSVRLVHLSGRQLRRLGRRAGRTSRMRSEIDRLQGEARKVSQDIAAFSAEQQSANPLDPNRKTVFLLITCGQAVRNFLLSDFFSLLKGRFNIVILTTFAYSEGFRKEYSAPGVHVLPWFSSFRTTLERMFQYYFMTKSRSRTHQGWLANLEARAKSDRRRSRYKRLSRVLRVSHTLGRLLGWRGMQGLYASYFLSYLPKSLFSFLFATYGPALVISTTAHHPEAWPLTFFARRNRCQTLANVLSWDNPTTKTIMDISCDYYTVWSEEMKGEFAFQFPHIQTEVIITGCPLFDVYYQKPYAKSRETFVAEIGLPTEKPYILYATNTPAAMPDEGEIVKQYWKALSRSPLGGKIGMLVRLHPKDNMDKYQSLVGLQDVVVTRAAKPHWDQCDRWLPNHEDMNLLLNSMMHAAVSVNVASTMSLESFALDLPTINVGFKARKDFREHNSMWSFDMVHFSEHYHAIVENGAVDFARSVDQLVNFTIEALQNPRRNKEAMRKTLAQKAMYCDGTSGRRFFEVVVGIVDGHESGQLTIEPGARHAMPTLSPLRVVEAAE
jgi:CDP-Glycerol:Poly(glycerophosphate) glycerophosphotransferase